MTKLVGLLINLKMNIDQAFYSEPMNQFSRKWRDAIDCVIFANTMNESWDDKLWVSTISFPEDGYDGDNSLASVSDLDVSSRSLVLDPDRTNGQNFPPGHLQLQEASQHDYSIKGDEANSRLISSLEMSTTSAAAITHHILDHTKNTAQNIMKPDCIHGEKLVPPVPTLSCSQAALNLNPVAENSRNNWPSLVMSTYTGNSAGQTKRGFKSHKGSFCGHSGSIPLVLTSSH